MKNKIETKYNRDPFRIIKMLPNNPLFKDCPIKPSDELIDAAEELYLKFSYDPPTYISSKDEQIIFEWNFYEKDSLNRQKLCYSKELIIKDPINMEWRTQHF